MKKITLSLIFANLIITANAQFKIDAANNIGIGASPIAPAQVLIQTPPNPYFGGLVMFAQTIANWNPAIHVQVNPNNTFLFAGYQGTTLRAAIYGQGSMWTQLGYSQGSDIRYKKNIEIISSALDKINKLSGVTYNFKEEFINSGTLGNSTGNGTVDEQKNPAKSSDNLIAKTQPSEEVKKQIEEESKRKRIGLIAQEVEKIVPEVVSTTPNGYKAIAYQELVPLLIEGIKEQQVQIEILKEQLAQVSSGGSVENRQGDPVNIETQFAKPQLFQNSPNPFNSETRVSFYIPKTVKSASLYIFNTEGKKNKTMQIDARGNGYVKIAANELSKGMYFYSLILDEKVFDSKTMLITE